MIPAPECKLGYTDEQVAKILGDRKDAFYHWMRGQTAAVCGCRTYDHTRKEYVPDDCGPHGVVVYSDDLKRFLRGSPPLD